MTANTLAVLVPGFGSHWAKGDSSFIGTDGSFTSHGVFAECSHFVRDNFASLSPAHIQGLASFVSDCPEGKYGDNIDNAAATCFLENLAGERLQSSFALQLRPAAKRFYDSILRSNTSLERTRER